MTENDLDFLPLCAPDAHGAKKAHEITIVLVAYRQGFRVLYEIENASVTICGLLAAECREQVQKMGHRFRADVHKITSFFSAAVPRFFGHGGFCLKIGGMAATAAAGAEDTPGTAHEVANKMAIRQEARSPANSNFATRCNAGPGGTDDGRGAANADCSGAAACAEFISANSGLCR